MTKIWSDDYLTWQTEDKKILKRINALIKDIERNGAATGIGKPERLKYRDAWSRRIDRANRLLYDVDTDNNLLIIACCGHYDE
ncbi:txe/YoeB family addiction module toxin [Synergistales bacterium]|nr:txe/YoeB family addiction module toxin [Synergistales bacterium]